VPARPAATAQERATLLLVLPLEVLLFLDHLAPRALLLEAVGRIPPILRVVQRVGGLRHDSLLGHCRTPSKLDLEFCRLCRLTEICFLFLKNKNRKKE
jgi:hypothetical protein